MAKCTGRGLVVKRPGVLSKVQMLNLVLGVGGLFPSSNAMLGLRFPIWFFFFFQKLMLGTPRPGTECSRALRARNPKRVRKKVRKGVPRPEPQSPQRVRPGVRKESKKSPKLRFWALFGLRGALFGDSRAPRGRRPGTPSRTFLDSFGLPGPKTTPPPRRKTKTNKLTHTEQLGYQNELQNHMKKQLARRPKYCLKMWPKIVYMSGSAWFWDDTKSMCAIRARLIRHQRIFRGFLFLGRRIFSRIISPSGSFSHVCEKKCGRKNPST